MDLKGKGQAVIVVTSRKESRGILNFIPLTYIL